MPIRLAVDELRGDPDPIVIADDRPLDGSRSRFGSRSRSCSRSIPVVVTLNAHASMTATGSPSAASTTSIRNTHAGAPSPGRITSATCNTA